MFTGVLPSRDAVDRALDVFRGTFLQQPPAFSAKKIDGTRSHKLARARRRSDLQSDRRSDPQSDRQSDPQSDRRSDPELPAPANVTVHRLELVGAEADRLTLTVDCSAGFYIRSLAHDLGQALGTGAHLDRLRRTRSGDFTLAGAIELAAAEQDPDFARASVVPLAGMLLDLRAVVLTVDGVRHAIQGRDLGPSDVTRDSGLGIRDSRPDSENESPVPAPKSRPSRFVRLMNQAGALVGIAEAARTPGLLHPFVVLM